MPRNKKTILIISPFFSPNVGGVETHLDDYCRYLVKKEYKVVVLTYQPLTTKTKGKRIEKRENLTIYRMNWFGHGLFHKFEKIAILQFLYLVPGLFFRTFFFLIKNHGKVKVIHSHGLAGAFISGVLGKIFFKRSLVSFHTMYRFSSRPIIAPFVKFVLDLNDKVLVLGKDGKKDLEDIGLKAAKIDTYVYWVNHEMFFSKSKENSRFKLSLPQGKFIILFVGRFVKQKGVGLVVEAAKLCDNTHLFLFIGEGPEEVYIKDLCRYRENAVLIGKIDNKELCDYYNAADILSWGSMDLGYLGRICIEAITCGLPFVAPKEAVYFDIPKEVTTKDVDPAIGVLSERDPKALAEILSFFKNNPEKLRELSSSAVKYARSNYSEINAEKILEAYD